MHASELTLKDNGTSGTDSHSSRHDMLAINIRPDINTAHFYFLLQKLCQLA